jgi:diacylglycerol kinase family enzyme
MAELFYLLALVPPLICGIILLYGMKPKKLTTIKSLFVVLNPHSSKAVETFNQIKKYKKDFIECGDYNNVNLLTNESAYDFLCLGGDGTIFNLIQQLVLKPNASLLVYPSGTSNGIAKSLGINHLDDASKALKRLPDLIPLMKITQSFDSQAIYGMMSFSWGAIADFDYLSEIKLRWLGFLRMFIIPFIIIMFQKKYIGTISLTLLNDEKVEKKSI